MLPVTRQFSIAAPIERVWTALTDPSAIQTWLGGHSHVTVDLRVGGQYSLFDGEITGSYRRIEAPHHLEYTWRTSEWLGDWQDSIVTWELIARGQSAQVTLTQQPFPTEEERQSHEDKWDVYFIEPMKGWLESAL